MDDFMNDINSPPQPSAPVDEHPNRQPAEPPVQNTNYSFKPINSYDMENISDGERSIVADILKAVLGAVVGALPGILLWIIIGKVGFIAAICGTILAGGAVAGYTFMTKDNSLSTRTGIIICAAVIIIAIYMAEKIVWCWEMSEQFQRVFTKTRNEAHALGSAGGLTTAEIDRIVDNELREQFGFVKGTFGDFFSNFNKTLYELGLSSRYYINLLECYLFAALGSFSIFKKTSGKI